MNLSRQEISDGLARRRYFQQVDQRHAPKPPRGETVEEAIARGCPYTVIAAPRIAEYRAPDFVPSAPKPRKPTASSRWAPGREFCPASQRYTAAEFDLASRGPRNFRPRTLAALRLVAVDGESFASAAAEAGIEAFDLRQRFKKFNERAGRLK